MTSPGTIALDQKYRIGDRLRVVEREGYALVTIDSPACTAELSLQGAQVLRWRPVLPGVTPADVLWCAPLPPAGSNKAIRGGIPVCWPWFGPHASDPAQPQHGLVRTAPWALTETAEKPSGIGVVFEHQAWGCSLRLEVNLGAELALALTTRNLGPEPRTITEALHTYFHVADVGAMTIHGFDGCTFRDNTDGGRPKCHSGTFTIARETIALFDTAPDICGIDDPKLGRRITLSRTGGRSTVVWNPGAAGDAISDLPSGGQQQFVCIESGNIGANAVTIAPGAEHSLAVAYRVGKI